MDYEITYSTLKLTQNLYDNYLPNCWVDLTLIVDFFLFWRKTMLTVTLEFNIKSTQNLSRYIFFRRRLVHVQWDWKYAVNFFTLYQVLEMKLTSSKTLEKSKGATPEIKIKTLIKVLCDNYVQKWWLDLSCNSSSCWFGFVYISVFS